MKTSKYIVIAPLILIGCSGSEVGKPDTKIPQIILVSSSLAYGTDDICGLPETHVFPLLSEQTLNLELDFSDDVELSQYKIDIHHNFDCHTHGRIKEVGEPWFVARIEKLEGRVLRITEELKVPANVTAGNYHLLIYCLDKVGNEAEPLVFSMKIKNKNDTQLPTLTLTEPSVEGVTLKREESVNFKGTITDNTDLTDGRIELFYYDPDNTLFTVNQYLFSEDVGKEYSFDIPYTIESTSSSGVHQFHLKVYDRYNNSTEKIIPITIE
jgi:hypothetical protein